VRRFLHRRSFSKAEIAKIIDTVLAEEGRSPESISCQDISRPNTTRIILPIGLDRSGSGVDIRQMQLIHQV
jgi:hypothetical protein